MEKVLFWKSNSYELINSASSIFVVIKLNKIKDGLKNSSQMLKEELNTDYLAQPGVYFLRLKDGYYIGETTKLEKRFAEHIKNHEITNITFATSKSEIDHLNKEKIKDLEAILMELASDSGLILGKNLKNKKHENRKIHNTIERRYSFDEGSYIWSKISYLNLQDILSEIKVETIEKKNNPVKTKKASKKLPTEKQLLLKKSISFANIKDHYVDPHDSFFEIVPFRKDPSRGYNRVRNEIFNKDNTKSALFAYLYNGIGVPKVDANFTNNIRKNGYVTSVTLAYLRIETNGSSRGILNKLDIHEAKSKIDKFVDQWYNKQN